MPRKIRLGQAQREELREKERRRKIAAIKAVRKQIEEGTYAYDGGLDQLHYPDPDDPFRLD